MQTLKSTTLSNRSIAAEAISAEIYPSMVRGTGAGISAAFGKLGATVGSYAFSELKNLGYIRGHAQYSLQWLQGVGSKALGPFLGFRV